MVLIPLKKGKGGALKTERSYSFTDKRPVIDELRTLVEDGNMPWAELAEKADVSYSTLRNWFSGKTLRPQVPTVNKVARVFGKRIGLIDL